MSTKLTGLPTRNLNELYDAPFIYLQPPFLCSHGVSNQTKQSIQINTETQVQLQTTPPSIRQGTDLTPQKKTKVHLFASFSDSRRRVYMSDWTTARNRG